MFIPCVSSQSHWSSGSPESPREVCSRERPGQPLEAGLAGSSIICSVEMRPLNPECCFSPNRCKKRSWRRSRINAALTPFCICKGTWIKKDSKCASVHSTSSSHRSQTGPQDWTRRDTLMNTRAYEQGLPKKYTPRGAYQSGEGKKAL